VILECGALLIEQWICLTDEETIVQIRDNASIHFFLGFAGYPSKAPLDQSMMVHFPTRFIPGKGQAAFGCFSGIMAA
jgi:IS5 family transposase